MQISIRFFSFGAASRRQDRHRRGRGPPGTWEVPQPTHGPIPFGTPLLGPLNTPDFGRNRPNPGFRPCSGPEKSDENRLFRRKLFFPGSSSPSPARTAGRNPDSERSIFWSVLGTDPCIAITNFAYFADLGMGVGTQIRRRDVPGVLWPPPTHCRLTWCLLLAPKLKTSKVAFRHFGAAPRCSP